MYQKGSNDLLIETLKLKQLVSTSKTAVIASTIIALVLAYVQHGIISQQVILIWLLSVLFVNLARFIWLMSAQKKVDYIERASQLSFLFKQFRIGIFFAGLSWGLSGYFLFPEENSEHEIFLIFMLAGLSAGAMTAYALDLFSAISYITLTLLPIALKLIVIGSYPDYWMVFSVLLFFGFLITNLLHIHHDNMDNILLRIDSNVKDTSIKVGEERYHLLLEHLPMGVFHFDNNHQITFCNQQLKDIFQGSSDFQIGANLDDLEDKEMLSSLKTALSRAELIRYEGMYGTKPAGTDRWVGMLFAPVTSSEGQVSGGIGIVQDITERKESTKLTEKFALQDYLTELPNRRDLINHLQRAIDAYSKQKRDVALLYIDLDNFKSLNDAYGHAVGDLLLQKVSQRLVQSLRPKDLVARASRIGGDEFVVVLEGLSDHAPEALNQATVVANKIVDKLHQPFKLNQHQYECALSIGMAMYTDSNGTVDDFLKHADIAMYEAKKGKETLEVYNQKMLDLINNKESVRRALIKAIKNEEFELYYQVQVNAAQKAIGAEALIRWSRPRYGIVPPNEFIPIAEEVGLIVDIGDWVLGQACMQLKAWSKVASRKHLAIAVNVSAIQLQHQGFAERLEHKIKKYKVKPALLKIEVTESMFLDNTSEVIDTINALQKIGVGVELDDFGTGYSCLQYLKQLPLQQLKIDRSFVNEINHDKNDQSIVKTIIAMAEGFNINVIAEGVETEQQFELLKSYDCHHFQGYLFGRPMPIDVFESSVMKNRKVKPPLVAKVT